MNQSKNRKDIINKLELLIDWIKEKSNYKIGDISLVIEHLDKLAKKAQIEHNKSSFGSLGITSSRLAITLSKISQSICKQLEDFIEENEKLFIPDRQTNNWITRALDNNDSLSLLEYEESQIFKYPKSHCIRQNLADKMQENTHNRHVHALNTP